MSSANVSIIVTCQEQESQLRQLLPQLLSLQCEGEYEVIVVDEQGDKDLAEWLEEMEVRYPYLYHTFCPTTARGIDIHKLALTLGAKAANNEWLVILSAAAQLPGDDWLSSLTTCRDDQTDIVIGVTGRKHRLNWLSSLILRHRFSLFRPSSSVILCRRSILLQADPHIVNSRIICHSL